MEYPTNNSFDICPPNLVQPRASPLIPSDINRVCMVVGIRNPAHYTFELPCTAYVCAQLASVQDFIDKVVKVLFKDAAWGG
jgi:hypothetical protein